MELGFVLVFALGSLAAAGRHKFGHNDTIFNNNDSVFSGGCSTRVSYTVLLYVGFHPSPLVIWQFPGEDPASKGDIPLASATCFSLLNLYF